MTTVTPIDSCVHNLSESLSDTRRLRELLIGAAALLMRGDKTSPNALSGARSTMLEASAVTDQIIDRLEAFTAWQAEQQRNLHVAQAAKHISKVRS